MDPTRGQTELWNQANYVAFNSRGSRTNVAIPISTTNCQVTAVGADAIVRFLERSSANDLSLALIIGSPSACLSSSLISCLLMRMSRRHFILTQMTSPIASAAAGMHKTLVR